MKEIPDHSRTKSVKGHSQVINLGQHQRGMPIYLQSTAMKTFVAHDITNSREDRNNVRNKMLYFKKANFKLGNDPNMFNA